MGNNPILEIKIVPKGKDPNQGRVATQWIVSFFSIPLQAISLDVNHYQTVHTT